MTDIRFDGKVAVVTGAGGGLGRQHALLLASRGAMVVVNDLGGAMDGTGGGTSAADSVVEEIKAAGGEAAANYDTVSTPEGGRAIVACALDTFGGVDIVINNAGILRDKSFAKLSNDDLEAVLTVHLRGGFHVSQPAFAHMKEAGYGRFVFTSSSSGLFGNFGQSNYGAAKAGLVGLSSVLALEGMKYNIRSNVIAPIAKSRMTEELIGELGDFLDPALVSPLVAYLVSEECEFTHEVFSAGGGRYARVFTALTPGWLAGRGGTPSIEEVREKLPQICAEAGYAIPKSSGDEVGALAAKLRE